MCKVAIFDLLEEGGISAPGKILTGEQNPSAQGSWGSFPGEVPLKLGGSMFQERRVHRLRDTVGKGPSRAME